MAITLYGKTANLQEIIKQRRNDAAVINGMLTGKQDGRDVSNNRSVPSSPIDTESGDKIGDFVITATHIYTLLNVQGVLKWHRQMLDITW